MKLRDKKVKKRMEKKKQKKKETRGQETLPRTKRNGGNGFMCIHNPALYTHTHTCETMALDLYPRKA